MAEGLNSKIQMLKYRAHGYRNDKRFEAVIMFHLGGLDLSPAHSKSRRAEKRERRSRCDRRSFRSCAASGARSFRVYDFAAYATQ